MALDASKLAALQLPDAPWTDHVAALGALTEHATALSDDFHDELLEQLLPLGPALAHCISGLRSSLVKEACACVAALAVALGAPFVEKVGAHVIPALLRRASTTKAVIRDSAVEAAKTMFRHGVNGVSLQTACALSRDVVDKKLPAPTRSAAALFVGMMLVEDCISGLQSMGPALDDSILHGCNDPDESVRAASRENWRRLEALDQGYAAQLLSRLPPHVVARILKEKNRSPLGPSAEALNFEYNFTKNDAAKRPFPQRVVPGARLRSPSSSPEVRRSPPRAPYRPQKGPYRNTQGSFASVKTTTAVKRAPPPLPPKNRTDAEGLGTLHTAKVRNPALRPMRPPRRSMMPNVQINHQAVWGVRTGATRDSARDRQSVPIMGMPPIIQGPANPKRTEPTMLWKFGEVGAGGNDKPDSSVSWETISTPPLSRAPSSEASGDDASVEEEVRATNDYVLHSPVSQQVARSAVITPQSASSSAGSRQGESTVDFRGLDDQLKRSGKRRASLENSTHATSKPDNSAEKLRKARISFLVDSNVSPPHDVIGRGFIDEINDDHEASAGECSVATATDLAITSSEVPASEPSASVLSASAISSRPTNVSMLRDQIAEDSAMLLSAPSLDKPDAECKPDLAITEELNEKVSSAKHECASRHHTGALDASTSDAAREMEDNPLGGSLCHEEACDESASGDVVDSVQTRMQAMTLSSAGKENGGSLVIGLDTLSSEETRTKAEKDVANAKKTAPSQRPKWESQIPQSSTKASTRKSLHRKALSSETPEAAEPPEPSKASLRRGPRRSVMPSAKSSMGPQPPATLKPKSTAKLTVPRVACGSNGAATERRMVPRPPAGVKATTALKPGPSQPPNNSRTTTAQKPRVVPPTSANVFSAAAPAVAPKKKVRSAAVRSLIEQLRLCNRMKTMGWEERCEALSGFTEACEKMQDNPEAKLGLRLGEDCIAMLGHYMHETHHRVVSTALDGLFFLLLCNAGSADNLQHALERRDDVLKRTLGALAGGKSSVRMAAERVMQGIQVQFKPEICVLLIMRAMTHGKDGAADARRGTTSLTDWRVAEMGCQELAKAFQRATTSGEGFVWIGGLVERVLLALKEMRADRRQGVRKGATVVLEAVKENMVEAAFDIACEKYGVRLGEIEK